MTPEERLKFASEFLSKLIDADMNLQEVREATKFAADAMEFADKEGISLEELANHPEKLAFVSELTQLPGKLMDTGGKGIDLAGKVLGIGKVPLYGAMATAAVAPYVLGRYTGGQVGSLTDRPDDYTEEIKAKELLSLIRDNTATLERRKALRDGETSGNADY